MFFRVLIPGLLQRARQRTDIDKTRDAVCFNPFVLSLSDNQVVESVLSATRISKPDSLYYHKPTSHSLLLFNALLHSLSSLTPSHFGEWYDQTCHTLSHSLKDDVLLLDAMLDESDPRLPLN